MRESWNNGKIEAYLLEVASTLGPLPRILQNSARAPMLSLLPDLRWLKQEAHKAYCARYGMDPKLPAVVEQADLVLLATERRDLMAPCEHEWMPMPPALPAQIIPISQHREDIPRLVRWRVAEVGGKCRIAKGEVVSA